MNEIDPIFFDKKFNATRYLLRNFVAASSDELRREQSVKIRQFRDVADKEIAGVVDENFTNFNTSLARFTSISNQLQSTRQQIEEINKRSIDGKNILSSKTKNIRELLLQKYEAKKVIEIINDIQYIESAPTRIQAMLQDKNFTGAVHMFSKSIELVFCDRLVSFHAITSIRNALMECKQAIEDQLVQELHNIIYLKSAFSNLSRVNQYTLASVLHELDNDSLLDQEFDKFLLETKQQQESRSTSGFAEVLPSALASSSSSSSGQQPGSEKPTTSRNVLESAVEAVKVLHREVDVVGTLKSCMDDELNDVFIQISMLCRHIFNSSSYTSFENHFSEKTFGRHDHSSYFQLFLRLLCHVLKKIAVRHFLVAIYLQQPHANTLDVMTKLTNLVERVLTEYVEDEATETNGLKDASTDLHDQLTSTTVVFKLSLNRRPRENASSASAVGTTIKPQVSAVDGPGHSHIVAADTTTSVLRVCIPSVFHLPVVYEDLEQVANELERLCLNLSKAPAPPTKEIQTASGLLKTRLHQFVSEKWIPQVRTKAHQLLSQKNRNSTSLSAIPVPSDTCYQPLSIDTLLTLSKQIGAMMNQIPAHRHELIGVLEATVQKWLEECAQISKEIREPTLNHKELLTSVAFGDLVTLFHDYDIYQRAKGNVPLPFQHKVVPTTCTSTTTVTTQTAATTRDTSSMSGSSSTIKGLVSVTAAAAAQDSQASLAEKIAQKEHEMEQAMYDPDFWVQGAKGLVLESSKVAMLAYINCACDLMASYLQQVNETESSRTSSSSSSSSTTGQDSSAGRASPASSTSLQATIWKCSALADDCLFFLRREIRLQSFHFLTQLVAQRFDCDNEQLVIMAQDCVLGVNINLSRLENAIQPYLSSDKMTLVFDGIDTLLARILITNLQFMTGALITKAGVQQMLLNLESLHQGLTGILYAYPTIGRSGIHFEHAKRYFQLLLLAETQLEMFVLENRKCYDQEAFRALWRVETPHRVLTKGSVNKLDSILRAL